MSGCSSLRTAMRSCVKVRTCFGWSSVRLHLGSVTSGSERPTAWAHVFASIQSLHRIVDSLQPDQFDVVIVDEFHHAEADTYRKLLDRLSPKVLLGLTATPERADGNDILHWFDDRIAYEMRLWEALDRGLSVPFHYLGVSDGTDLGGSGSSAGDMSRATSRKSSLATTFGLSGSSKRSASGCWTHRACGRSASAPGSTMLGSWLTNSRRRASPSVALDGTTDSQTRRDAVAQLRSGELRAIFTVDIFNEGVDIPEVDTLLLLRPTESATIFLQQLGRGLRYSPESGKSVLTVLDFIGQAHADYRFDIRYRALIGGTRAQIARAVEHGFPSCRPGCAIRLDEIAQEIVLDEPQDGDRQSPARADRGPARTAARHVIGIVPRPELIRPPRRLCSARLNVDIHSRSARRGPPPGRRGQRTRSSTARRSDDSSTSTTTSGMSSGGLGWPASDLLLWHRWTAGKGACS